MYSTCRHCECHNGPSYIAEFPAMVSVMCGIICRNYVPLHNSPSVHLPFPRHLPSLTHLFHSTFPSTPSPAFLIPSLAIYLTSRGPYAAALGRFWHPEHFTCTKCLNQLSNQTFVVEGDEPYCEPCYEKSVAPMCEECKHIITGVSASIRAIHTSVVKGLVQDLQKPMS